VRLLSGIFIVAALFLIVRLYFVQIVHGDEYRQEATGQYVKAANESDRRGDIFFTRKDGGNVAAAVMQSGYTIAIRPGDLVDANAVYEELKSIAVIDKERFFNSAAKVDDPYEEVAFRLDEVAADAVREKDLPGVFLVRSEWRMYPGQSLAAHAIGFVGYKGDVRAGVYGLERYYEDSLKRDASSLYVNPFAEIFTNVAAVLSADITAQEGNIITTIEPDAQIELTRTLGEIAKEYSPKEVGGIIMDPKTGDIVAMAVLPDFNPNTYNLIDDSSVFSNPIVESRYEMGSIMKPLTMAAGIDSGAVTPKTTYEDRGFIMRSGYRIANYDGKGRGVVPMQEILSQSLNTGTTFVAEKVGHEKFAEYFTALGFGEETGIDLPNEIAGDMSSLTTAGSADVDLASASFGQGIAVTPIAMTRALAALANGGVLPEPHLASAVRYPSGIERKITQAPPKRVFTQETADTVTRMLVKVFDEGLLKGELKQEHYSIAAKTGTAQIGGQGCKGYCEGKYLHSFFGYFPAHDPRFIILMYQVEPRGVEYASQSLARPFFGLAKFLINYYNIPPDR
jgi:cell division protein FtsI/penicillin-binding protein 2